MSINTVIQALEENENVERTDVEYEDREGDLIVSALVDEVTDEFQTVVEEDLGMEIEHKKWVCFGYEVTLS